MATIAARINSSGTYFVNGSFDEVTYNSTTPAIKNLLTYTEQFDQSFWTKTRSSIGATNTIISPDGTLTAEKLIEDTSTSSTHYINGPGTSAYVTIPGFPTGSIYVKAGERTYCALYVIRDGGAGFVTSAFVVNVTDGSIVSGTGTVYSAGNGWYRLSVTATSTGTNYAIRFLLYQNSSTNTYTGDGVSGLYIWGAQLEATTTVTSYQGIAAANTLVPTAFKNKVTTDIVYVTDIFDEVTYSSTSPTIKNLLRYTEDFSQWANVGHTITVNQATAPNGTLTADRIQVTTGTANDYTAILNNSTVFGASYTFSFWVKSVGGGTGTWPVNWYGGGIHHRSTVPITGEWTRQYITFTGTGGLVNVYIADNRSSLASITDAYVWGAQLERGTTPTIYQGIAATDTLISPEFAKRDDSTGATFVTGSFDEVTGMIVSAGLVLQLDPGKVESFRSTSTSVIDISGNTQNFNITGLVTYESTTSSLLFDTPAVTTDNRLTISNTSILFADASEYTIEFWCKIASNALATYYGIAGRGTTNPWVGILKGSTDFKLFFREITSGAYFYSTSITPSVFAGWVQVVFSVSSGRVVSYYINHAAGTFADTNLVTTSTFTISRLAAGYSAGGNFYAFNGNVGPINVYNRTLSLSEINNNFQALRNRFGI